FAVLVAVPAFAAAGLLGGDIERLRGCWIGLVWAALAVAVVSGAIWLVLLAGDIYAAPLAEVWHDGGVWTVATATRFGQISLARLAAAALLAALLPTVGRSAAHPPWRSGAVGLVVGLAILLLVGPGWAGPAGAP